MRILITERLVDEAIALLRSEHDVEVREGLSQAELASEVGAYDALIVRSRSRVTCEVLERAPRLKLIARAGTGVDNIDVDAATRQGVMVINVPNGNVVAVAEHTLALMLALARHIPRADAALRAGRWAKGALEGVEISGKTLGIIGLGRIGTEVAKRALALGMRVIASDPLVSPEYAGEIGVALLPMERLLAESDFISIHVPGAPSTRKLIGAAELAMVKPGCRIVNCARGGILDEEALLQALDAGRVAGAALDVFEHEPAVDERLRRDERIVLTPHIAGSTAESRVRVGMEVAHEVLRVLRGQPPMHPVNLPAMSPREWEALRAYLTLAERLAIVGAALMSGQLRAVTVECSGPALERALQLLTSAALQGLLAQGGEKLINLVNARSVAKARGLTLHESYVAADGNHNTIMLRLETTHGTTELLGDLMRGMPHVLRVNGYWLEFPLRGRLLFSEHREGPGVLGDVGVAMAASGISISFVQLGRTGRGGRGLMVLGLDDAPSPESLARLRALPSLVWLREVALPLDNGRQGADSS